MYYEKRLEWTNTREDWTGQVQEIFDWTNTREDWTITRDNWTGQVQEKTGLHVILKKRDEGYSSGH
jgi:hypothetical protein